MSQYDKEYAEGYAACEAGEHYDPFESDAWQEGYTACALED